MAPLPANNTRRYWLDYSVGGVEHSAMIRTAGAYSPASFGTSTNALLNTISGQLFALTVIRVRTAAVGQDFSVPVTTGIEGNVYGSTIPFNNQIPQFAHFVGRTSGGRRSGFFIYGWSVLDNSFRVTPSEQASVGTAVSLLNTADGYAVGIDGLETTFYPYVDVALNAYWQRKRRS